ncbi:hypothetical protein HYV74_02045 [Candidatus Uhrbacteria bacterium]|nr:hypothetical protein [Candidatus Uhrbacteria bacterium]
MLETFRPRLEIPSCAYCDQPLERGHVPGCAVAQPVSFEEEIRAFEQDVQAEHADEHRKREHFAAHVRFFDRVGAHLDLEYSKRILAEARQYPGLVVRRENLQMLPRVLERGLDLRIRFDPSAHGGDPYPNAALLGTGAEGLRIPFGRGFGKVYSGAEQFIVGFLPPADMRVAPVPDGSYVHYRGADRAYVRMVSGNVPRERLRFVILRLPRHAFPESEMTSTEQLQEMLHISRLFVFAHHENEPSRVG